MWKIRIKGGKSESKDVSPLGFLCLTSEFSNSPTSDSYDVTGHNSSVGRTIKSSEVWKAL